MLDPQQQKKISDFLTQRGVTFEPLLDEMMDHITCDIEANMINGTSFEEAFNIVTRTIPNGQLSVVQTQTISSIPQKKPKPRKCIFIFRISLDVFECTF